jgi:hypothetical protein
MNDWEYREPTQADCVPDKDGNYPMVTIQDVSPTIERPLLAVLPVGFKNRFVCANKDSNGYAACWYNARIRKSYAERQAEWIERNGIKVGSRVRVTRSAESGEDGWPYSWFSVMSSEINEPRKVDFVDKKHGITLVGSWCFPYFVLETVPEPEPEYRKPTINDIGQLIEVSRNGELWESFTLVGLHDGTFYVTGILQNVATPFKKARIKVR